jgi:23S rRNA (uracil-5-)-methyltransferase RumA
MKEFSTKEYLNCPFLERCAGCEKLCDVFHPPLLDEIFAYFKNIEPLLSVKFSSNGFFGKRFKAKLAVRKINGEMKIGLFKKGTHDVLEILECPAHHHSINEALVFLKKRLVQFHIEPYSEKKKTGLLRYLQLSVEKEGGKVGLVLVLNKKEKQDLKKIKEFIKFLNKDFFSSIWLNFQNKDCNAIFGEEWVRAWGEEFLWQKITTRNFAFHPASFSQANIELFEGLVFDIMEEAKDHKKILELYAGNGSIGLNLATNNNEITFVEQNLYSKISFDKTIEKDLHLKVKYINEDVKKEKHLIHESDLIIVDPPRKGLDAEILEELIKKSKGVLFYISCSFSSFKKDLEHLLKNGWKIKKINAYLFFPGTNHVETFSVLEKKSG